MSQDSIEVELQRTLAERTRAEAMLSSAAKMRDDGEIDDARYADLKAVYSERLDAIAIQVERIRTNLREKREEALNRIEEIGNEERDLDLRVDIGQITKRQANGQAEAFEQERAELEDQIHRLAGLVEAEIADDVEPWIEGQDEEAEVVEGESAVSHTASTTDEKSRSRDLKNRGMGILEQLADAMTEMPVVEPLAAPLREYLGSGRTLTLVAGIVSTVAASFLPMAVGYSLNLMHLSPLTLVLAVGIVGLHFVGRDKARAAGQALFAASAATAWVLAAIRLNSAGISPTFGYYLYISGSVAALIGAHMQVHKQ